MATVLSSSTSKVYGSSCSSSDVIVVHSRKPSPPILLTGRWTKHQDSMLRQLVEESSTGEDWRTIAAAMFPNRTLENIVARWHKVLLPGFVKGTWSRDEDDKIIEMKSRGFTEWVDVSLKVIGRSAKQCRDRWANHLDPSISKSEWSFEEDVTLFRAHTQLGNAWTEVAKLMPGRSENAVKNRWNSAALRESREASQKRRFRLIIKPKPEQLRSDVECPEVCWVELKANPEGPIWWPTVIFSSVEAIIDFELPLPPEKIFLAKGERLAYCCGPHFTFEVVSNTALTRPFMDLAAPTPTNGSLKQWTSPTDLALAVEEARLYIRIMSKSKRAKKSPF
jgi:hypothetical protein